MLDYKSMQIEDIIEWCQENGKVEWLKKEAAKTVTVERYSGRIQVTKANGKKAWIADKNSEKIKEQQPITFFQLKKAFATKFMPEILPVAKPKAKTMYDKIAAL